MNSNVIACVAPGPSLTAAQCARLQGRCRVLVVNNAYQLAPWASWLYACDQNWWDEYAHDVANTFQGELWTNARRAAAELGINRIDIAAPPERFAGLSTKPGVIHGGWNGGYQAINLALHFGAKRIVLLGYDLHGTHFFGEYSNPLLARHSRDFKQWMASFKTIDPAHYGVEIINCTPGSALTHFPQMALQDALQGLACTAA